MTNTPDMSLQAVERLREAAKLALAVEISAIEPDTRLRDLTDDETDSIVDGILASWRLNPTPSTVTEGTVPDDGVMVEADAEVERILSLSDDQVLAEASPEDLAWAKLLKARMIAIMHALPGRYDGVSSHATIRGDADDAPYMLAIREALSSSPKPTTVESSGMVEGHAKVHRLIAFMAEQTEREAVVDWLRKVGDSKPHGTDWRAYYEAAEAIETEQHRKALSASSPSSEQGRGS